jgi:hypothetical protein
MSQANSRIQLFDPNKRADVTLVDTGAGIGDDDLKGLTAWSDLVIVPFLLSPTDMRATGSTVHGLLGHDKVRLLFSAVDPRTAVFRDRQSYADLLGVKALKAYLPVRHCYRLALVNGFSALSSVARKELAGLAEEITSEV